jgi:flavin-dependent dehydrogenase
MEPPSENSYEVIIVGGGPAGSCAAAVLAEYGHRVLILEREKFPRYHVGESLIPFTFGPLERIGMIPKMRASHFTKKYSVVFVQPDGRASEPFYFFNRYDRNSVAQTWQVVRSEFDQMMLDNAREKGAIALEENCVTELIKREDGRVIGARAKDKEGRVTDYRAQIVLDCTGKEAFCSVRLGWRTPDPNLRKLAIWTYYQGSTRASGINEGETTVAFVPEKGWFWHIPQHGDMVSVGIVAEPKYLTRDGVREPKAMFDREVEENPWIKERLSTGRCTGEYFVTSEFSHQARHCGAPGLLLVGDAFAFLDPVFSSGLLLALKSGMLAGESVHTGLLGGDLSPEHFRSYGNTLHEGIENMRKLVYAFYNPDFSLKSVIKRYPDAADEITDCLSGDVNKDFSQLWSRIREFVPLPDDLRYGEPLVA